MTHQKHWIIKIVPVLAFATGIIMVSIGGVMTLSSGAKLALFDHEPYNQITREQCEFDYHDFRPIPVETLEKKSEPRKKTEEEIIKCIKERRIEEKQRFKGRQKQNLVDGLSVLIVGLILILGFRKKEE